MKPLALFSYRCTYRIELHFKNALHQSTEKAITNTQLLWHYFITVDILKCNARVVLNVLKVKIGRQQQREAQKPSVVLTTHPINSKLLILALGPTGSGLTPPPVPMTSLCTNLLDQTELLPCYSLTLSDPLILNVLIPILELQTLLTLED